MGPLSPLEAIVSEEMIDHLVKSFNLKKDYLSVSEMFVAKYEYGPHKQVSLKAHQDGTLFSFILTLNEPDVDFLGGGTRFLHHHRPNSRGDSTSPTHGVGEVGCSGGSSGGGSTTGSVSSGGGGGTSGSGVVYRPSDVGTAIAFCGKQLHEGVPVTSGVRYILTGFCEYNNCDRAGSHESFLEDYDPRWDGTSSSYKYKYTYSIRSVFIPLLQLIYD